VMSEYGSFDRAKYLFSVTIMGGGGLLEGRGVRGRTGDWGKYQYSLLYHQTLLYLELLDLSRTLR
jgi:hypothetical protein